MAAFSGMAAAFEQETKSMKAMANLRSLAALCAKDGGLGNSSNAKALIDELFAIEALVCRLNNNLDSFDELMTGEEEALNEMEVLKAACMNQSLAIQAAEKSIPTFLRLDTTPSLSSSVSSAPSSSSSSSATSSTTSSSTLTSSSGALTSKPVKSALKKKSSTSNVTLEIGGGSAIEAMELDKVSHTIRGRLTLAQVNEALKTLKFMAMDRRKILMQPKKKLSKTHHSIFEESSSLRLPEHDNRIFLTEGDIRSSPLFESGDATGKSILATLRSLSRVKLIRSGGESTYVLADPQ